MSFLRARKLEGNCDKKSHFKDRLIYDFGEKALKQLKISQKPINTNEIFYNSDCLEMNKKFSIKPDLNNFLTESEMLLLKSKRPNTAAKNNADRFYGSMSKKRF